MVKYIGKRDENMKTDYYKVIVINPEDESYELTDGIINFLGSTHKWHSEIMIDYGMEVYGKRSIFGILNQGEYLPIYPAFFLTEGEGNVVFLDISNARRK